jgi:U3 small nucleolar ribonucleoprotein protein IMP3
VHRLSLLPAEDPFRAQKEAEMLNKLWDMGVLGGSTYSENHLHEADKLELNSKPSDIENKLTVSSIARRRLAVVVTKLHMAETVSDVGHSPARDGSRNVLC